MKSTSFELEFDEDVTERGRYSPRFIDDIAGEIDIIEDKKASPFSKFNRYLKDLIALSFKTNSCLYSKYLFLNQFVTFGFSNSKNSLHKLCNIINIFHSHFPVHVNS